MPASSRRARALVQGFEFRFRVSEQICFHVYWDSSRAGTEAHGGLHDGANSGTHPYTVHTSRDTPFPHQVGASRSGDQGAHPTKMTTINPKPRACNLFSLSSLSLASLLLASLSFLNPNSNAIDSSLQGVRRMGLVAGDRALVQRHRVA